MNNGSLVEYMYDADGPKPYKCGYCRSLDTSLTQGLLGYRMTCRDYQDLVDRGFQRSGRYVYRAVMKRTCCPQYVIRMDVTEFTVTKSQRRAIKRFNEYLLYDKRYDEDNRKTPLPMEEGDGPSLSSADACGGGGLDRAGVSPAAMNAGAYMYRPQTVDSDVTKVMESSVDREDYYVPKANNKPGKPKKTVRPGVGADPNKPPCRKAKLMRMERKAKKLAAKQQMVNTTSDSATKVKGNVKDKAGLEHTASSSSTESTAGSARDLGSTASERSKEQRILPQGDKTFAQDLKELLALPNEADCKHKFETRLVCVNPRSEVFVKTYSESYAVFKKFQMIIHREKEEDSTERHFEEFLVQSPMENEPEGSENMPCMFGTYHQQYLLDGKIFAVGVIDILPRGILCEYLYYDPDYRFIAPGVYTALHEIAFTQKMFQVNPEMQYYYMGFYVQSCPKMNYKSRYNAGYLLCPETYQYIPITKCVPKLKASPYSRLADEDVPNAKEGCTDSELNMVPLFANMELTTFAGYRLEHGDSSVPLLKEYIDVVGLDIALRMSLFLGRRFFM